MIRRQLYALQLIGARHDRNIGRIDWNDFRATRWIKQVGATQVDHVGLAIIAVAHQPAWGVLWESGKLGLKFSAVALNSHARISLIIMVSVKSQNLTEPRFLYHPLRFSMASFSY
jgi:hypothetical protein